MSGHETIIITGKLSKDPEMKYTAAGLAVTRFSIPTDRKVGEERKTVWWNISAFGKAAESAGKNLHKGSVVRVEGVVGVDKETMTPRVYEKDGSWRSVCELSANVLTFLDNFGATEDKKEDASGATQGEFPF
jgi:single-strand DNA-binding protein